MAVNMPSDEEILERAFLSALKKHFPKPGPWLPPMAFLEPTGGSWRSGPDEVWEVYIQLLSAAETFVTFLESAGTPRGCLAVNGAGATMPFNWVWFPAFDSSQYDFIGAAWFDRWVTCPQGWILGNGEGLTVTSPFQLRMRRRFDLE